MPRASCTRRATTRLSSITPLSVMHSSRVRPIRNFLRRRSIFQSQEVTAGLMGRTARFSSLGQRVHRQLVRHRGLGECGSIRRVSREHEHWRRARLSTQPSPPCQRAQLSRRSRSSRSTTTADGRPRTSWSKTMLSRSTRRRSVAASFRRAADSTGSFRTTAPIRAGRHTTGTVVQKDITFEQNNVWRDQQLQRDVAFHGRGGRTRRHLGQLGDRGRTIRTREAV